MKQKLHRILMYFAVALSTAPLVYSSPQALRNFVGTLRNYQRTTERRDRINLARRLTSIYDQQLTPRERAQAQAQLRRSGTSIRIVNYVGTLTRTPRRPVLAPRRPAVPARPARPIAPPTPIVPTLLAVPPTHTIAQLERRITALEATVARTPDIKQLEQRISDLEAELARRENVTQFNRRVSELEAALAELRRAQVPITRPEVPIIPLEEVIPLSRIEPIPKQEEQIESRLPAAPSRREEIPPAPPAPPEETLQFLLTLGGDELSRFKQQVAGLNLQERFNELIKKLNQAEDLLKEAYRIPISPETLATQRIGAQMLRNQLLAYLQEYEQSYYLNKSRNIDKDTLQKTLYLIEQLDKRFELPAKSEDELSAALTRFIAKAANPQSFTSKDLADFEGAWQNYQQHPFVEPNPSFINKVNQQLETIRKALEAEKQPGVLQSAYRSIASALSSFPSYFTSWFGSSN